MVRSLWMAQYLLQLFSSSGVVIDRAAFQKGGATRMWLKAGLLVVCVQRVTRPPLLQGLLQWKKEPAMPQMSSVASK